jgi:hypothetical protein
MKFLVRLLPAVFLVQALAGSSFDHPLTVVPSKNLNTWLLGVWETRDDKGRASVAVVTPINCDHYALKFSTPGKAPRETKRYEFEAWPSKVGDTLFLTLRCLTSPGDIPTGTYVFTQVQLLDQSDVRTHGLKLDSPSSTSSFELRKEVRSKLKDHSLYEGAPSVVWSRVAEVFWSTNGADPTFPLRNPGNFIWGPNDDARDQTRKLFHNPSND